MPALYPQDMAQPVLAAPAQYSVFLTVTVKPGHEQAVREGLGDVAGLQRSVGFRIPEGNLSVVVGIGSDLWDRAYADLPRPAGLHPFVELHGAQHHAPSTRGDLFFHLRATRFDLCFELTQQLLRAFGDDVDPVDEVHGFRSFDERDLLGFVDGTENPPFGYEADDAALVPKDEIYAGASYVIIQKYVHAMEDWNALSVEEQQNVIGRTKLEDIELDDDVKPSNSHVALNTVEEPDGTERKIVRDNLPFGNAAQGEFGTFFIAYAADPAVTEEMLRNMFLGKPEGNYDRILDFSTAQTGCLFFCPPARLLEAPESYAASSDAPVDTTEQSTTPSGSLGIGSMKEQSV